MNFQGRAKRLTDIDLPLIAKTIGVGEDELHAFIDVETSGNGFDAQGRPAMLFEPHIFYRMLPSVDKRTRALKGGLATKEWKRAYPKDSYPKLLRAMEIDKEAALKSASWGLGQIMGFHHSLLGYRNAEAMVKAFMDDEATHLKAMVDFLIVIGVDDELRLLAKLTRPTRPEDTIPLVAAYNGAGFRKNNYHVKFANAHNRWRGIKDTDPNSPAPVDVPTQPIPEPVKPVPTQPIPVPTQPIPEPVKPVAPSEKPSGLQTLIMFLMRLFGIASKGKRT